MLSIERLVGFYNASITSVVKGLYTNDDDRKNLYIT